MAYNALIHAEWDISLAHDYSKYTPSKIFVGEHFEEYSFRFKVFLPTLRENTTLKFSFNFWMFI